MVDREASLGAGREPVAQPDVGERAAHHHLVVAPARAVRVELGGLHPLRHEIPARRAVLGDRARRRDVVRGDRIAQPGEKPRAVDVRQGEGRGRHPIEERRALDVGGVVLPCVGRSRGDLHRAPVAVSLEHRAVLPREHLLVHGRPHRLGDLGGRGPDLLQVHRRAAGVRAQRLRVKIDVHAARQGVGHHERR